MDYNNDMSFMKTPNNDKDTTQWTQYPICSSKRKVIHGIIQCQVVFLIKYVTINNAILDWPFLKSVACSNKEYFILGLTIFMIFCWWCKHASFQSIRKPRMLDSRNW